MGKLDRYLQSLTCPMAELLGQFKQQVNQSLPVRAKQ